jgi:HlyD family secretion protein
MNTMQRTLIVVAVLLVAGIAGVTFALLEPELREATTAATATPQLPAATEITLDATPPARPSANPIVADGRVVPVRTAGVTFSISGAPVAEILVEAGQQVAADAPLVRLDTADLQLQIDQAQAALARAQAEYDRLEAGATPAQIAQAETLIAKARAQLLQTLGSVTDADIAAAQARLEQARIRLAELQAGPRPEELTIAHAALDRAYLNLEQQRTRLSTDKTIAASQIDQAANALRNAQDEYSRIYWELADLVGRADTNDPALQEARNREAAALRAVEDAEANLANAQIRYDQSVQLEQTGLQTAEAQLREAQAQLDLLLQGPTAGELAAAQTQVADAQAYLEQLQGAARSGAVTAARANVTDAESRLDELLEGPLDSDLQQAAANITEREVALQQSLLALGRATLVAPIAGLVTEVNVDIGQFPSGNQPAIVLADTSEWQLVTEDLDDLTIVRVREGDRVSVALYALPGVELAGTVTRIKPLGRSADGGTSYSVTIAFDEQDERLRWGMIGRVTVEADD